MNCIPDNMKRLTPIPLLIFLASCSTPGKREFRALDSNQNGVVTAGEFAEHLTREGFRALDGNSDGKITLAEWSTAETARAAVPLFRELDSNRDGSLDMSEFQASRKKRAHFEGIFHSLDRDGDGALMWEEITNR
jgi:Ca2+-binding EF-hand superfamily protein